MSGAGPDQVPPDDPGLTGALTALVRGGSLLLALDFDGVLAPLVDDPAASRPLPESAAAVSRIAGSGTVVCYVSGRDLAGLTEVARADPAVHLVGSHGAQWPPALRLHGESGPSPGRVRPDGVSPGRVSPDGLSPDQSALLVRVTRELQAITAGHPGTRVEHKPTAAVLHTRLAEADVADRATRAVLTGPAQLPGVSVTPGKDVVELAVTRASKGAAVGWLRERFRTAHVLYIGDDVTDETVFTVLGSGDLGIKVGTGRTAAGWRIGSPHDVAVVLTRLADLLTGPLAQAQP